MPPDGELVELLMTVNWGVLARRFGITKSAIHHHAHRLDVGRQPAELLRLRRPQGQLEEGIAA